MEDNPHRFLNVMVRGTYIIPHRHCDPPQVRVIFGAVGRTLEAYARGAARNDDCETWLRAIGGAVALDMVLSEDWPHAAERIPFKATRTEQAPRYMASAAELFEGGRFDIAQGSIGQQQRKEKKQSPE